MNPVFWLLVILILVCIWFGLAILFKPIGAFLSQIINDTSKIINEEDSEEKGEDEE